MCMHVHSWKKEEDDVHVYLVSVTSKLERKGGGEGSNMYVYTPAM